MSAPNPGSPYRSFQNTEMWDVPECCQAFFTRIQGPLYFGATESVQRQFRRWERERPEQKHLVIGIDGMNDIDFAGAELLADEAKRRAAARSISS